MTEGEFRDLVEDRIVADVREALFALVHVWRACRDVRLLAWVDHSRWFIWVEYDDRVHLGGHSAVEGVRGEGKDADEAIRDCAVRWFRYVHEQDRKRAQRVDEVCAKLSRGFRCEKR